MGFNWPGRKDPNEKTEFIKKTEDGGTEVVEVPVLDSHDNVIGMASSPSQAEAMKIKAQDEYREAA